MKIPVFVKILNALGLAINPATDESVQQLVGNYAIRMDTITTIGVTYIGKAPIGSSTASSAWQIKKIDESSSPVDFIMTWADGNELFDNVWDNRASLTYN